MIIIRTNILERIIFIRTYVSVALIIGGIMVLFFDMMYNILYGSFLFGLIDDIIILIGICCTFFGARQEKWFDQENMQKDTEEKARQVKIEEKRREMEFADKYSGISRLWGVNWIMKWMYKEGWWYSGGLIFLIFLAFFIRITNLTALYPYTDEYSHLMAAMSIAETGTSGYTRAYFLSYIISLLFKFFGESLFIARLPGVFFGALTAIPIYLLVRNISKTSAIISVIFWIISPWAILISRNIREYAIFPFFMIFYLMVLHNYMQKLLKIISGDVKFEWKDMLLRSFFVIVPLVYALILDPKSSFKQILIFFPMLFLFFIYKIYSNKKINKNVKIAIFTIIVSLVSLGAGILLIFNKLSLVRFSPDSKYYLIKFFMDTLGYESALDYLFLIIIVLSGVMYIFLRKDELGITLILTLFFSFYFIYFHFERHVRPRYIFFILPFLIPIIGIGIYSIYNVICRWRFNSFLKKGLFISIMIFILFRLINPFSSYDAINYDKQGTVPWTDEYHDDVGPFLDAYKDKIKRNDVIIVTLGAMYRLYMDRPLNDTKMYGYNYAADDRFKKMEMTVSTNKEGWIILDTRRNGVFKKGLPLEDFEMAGKKIDYQGHYGDFHVYRWNQTATDIN